MAKYYKKIDNFFKEAKSDISKKIDITKEYKYNFPENNKNIVDVLYKDKVVLKAEYMTVGMYNIPLSFWYWGWSLPFGNKLSVIQELPQKLSKIKDFDNYTKEELEELYFITNNNSFYCSSQNIDRIIRFILYITKSLWYFPIPNNKTEVIEYIVITKILQIN